jgi:osmotically-inducible protein OsmY
MPMLKLLKYGFLLGCFSSLISCATAPNQTHPRHTQQPGPIEQYSHDTLITGKVKSKYLKDLSLKSFAISVSTNHGVVSLVGSVPTAAIRDRAIQVAQHTKGVIAVEAKNLTIVSSEK